MHNECGQHAHPHPAYSLAKYYERKCEEKPKKVALAAVMHKLVNIIFAVLRDRKPFELRTPEQHAQRLGIPAAA